jgi:7,8-dihydropterin-6-yl-methyl-4-(beta-D-ribofuranosyl)aminobenzene 5'-phosphate synthase
MLLTHAITAVLPAVLIATSAVVPATRVTVLYDAFGDRQDLTKDWGFAALVEHNGQRILFDTGNDADFFRHNVETLGVDLRNIDAVVISHRHGDHTDGLHYLLRVNPDVRIFVPADEYFGGPTPLAFFRNSVDTLPDRMRYYDGSVPEHIPHGTPWKDARLEMVTGRREILPGISVVSNVSRGEAFRETPELSLVIDTPQGQVVLVGCSHPGIEQILESVEAKTNRVRMIIGGLHWLMLPQAEVERLAISLRDDWNVESIAPGHCTGEQGFATLSRVYARRYHYAGLGTTLDL